MFTRRRFVARSALSSAVLTIPPGLRAAFSEATNTKPLRLAVLGSAYREGSALQTIADRFLVGYPLEGDWHVPPTQVVSLYIDQRARRTENLPSDFAKAMTGALKAPWLKPTPGVPDDAVAHSHNSQSNDTSHDVPDPRLDLSPSRASQFGIRLCSNIPEALRCGSSRLAVDAILAVVEQNDYPLNDRGQILLPQFDFFQQCAQVFESDGIAVPYFNHNQLSFSFSEANKMVHSAERLGFPLLAGSSMSVTWRLPDIDLPFEAPVRDAVMVGAGNLSQHGFAALEALQGALERRLGMETGVRAVQLLEGEDVWQAAETGRWSKELLSSALSRSDTPLGLTVLDGRTQDLSSPDVLRQLVKDPVACCINYLDGTTATLLFLNGALRDFNIAIRCRDESIVSFQFFMTPAPNETHSACLAAKIEQLYRLRRAPYSTQRALLTTGLLEACFSSKHRLNQQIGTPHLRITYKSSAESQFSRS